MEQAKTMGRPRGREHDVLVHVRMSQPLVERIERQKGADLGVDRSTMIRILLDEALKAREASNE